MRVGKLLFMALVGSVLGSAAQAVVVDEFTAGSFDSNVNFTDVTTDPGILGGVRTTEFVHSGGSNFGLYLSLYSFYEGGVVSYSGFFNQTTMWRLTYGGSTSDNNVLNLGYCDASSIQVGLGGQLDYNCSGDGPDGVPVTMTVVSGAIARSFVRMVHCAGNGDQGDVIAEFFYSDFPGIDFSAVDQLSFTFNQTPVNSPVDYFVYGINTICDDNFVGADEQPARFELGNAYPNPFNPATTLEFSLAENSQASLKVYDLSGRQVATLVDGLTERGSHSVTFDAGALPSGVYFYTLQADGQSQTRKMVLMK
ncbi:MAG: T9SS type A sorting domain-containing protein [Candidatus Delongbacteria bacterium]